MRTFLIKIYQFFFSPLLHGLAGLGYGCRFFPSCSQYASEAIGIHGIAKGMFLSLKRVSRCHPWGGSGYDPVCPLHER